MSRALQEAEREFALAQAKVEEAKAKVERVKTKMETLRSMPEGPEDLTTGTVVLWHKPGCNTPTLSIYGSDGLWRTTARATTCRTWDELMRAHFQAGMKRMEVIRPDELKGQSVLKKEPDTFRVIDDASDHGLPANTVVRRIPDPGLDPTLEWYTTGEGEVIVSIEARDLEAVES